MGDAAGLMAREETVECALIDTFPAFLSFWREAQGLPTEQRLERWANVYLAGWPKLLEKQQQAYADEGEDWRRVALERVAPFWAERLPVMREAHDHLLEVCQPVCARARDALGYERDLACVIYVGVGCGAGWATTFDGLPAVLLGLENIAEEGWQSAETLAGLLAHEIGHLWHAHLREQCALPEGAGPWWQLYSEGLAQRAEQLVMGSDRWHMQANATDWLSWCTAHRRWLASEFLRRVDARESVRDMFGSWYSIAGHKQCGYYLGRELIGLLEQHAALRDVALLEDIEGSGREALGQIAQGAM